METRAVPLGTVGQSLSWFFGVNFEGMPWPFPARFRIRQGRGNPAGWLSAILPDLVDAYLAASSSQVSELGADPAGFVYVTWLVENPPPSPADRAAADQADRGQKARDREAERIAEKQAAADKVAQHQAGLWEEIDTLLSVYQVRQFAGMSVPVPSMSSLLVTGGVTSASSSPTWPRTATPGRPGTTSGTGISRGCWRR